MKNKIKKSISVLISAILFISIMPFNYLKAEEIIGTYTEYLTGECIPFKYSGSTKVQGHAFSSDGRIVTIKSSSYYSGNEYLVVYVTLTNNTKYTYKTSNDNTAACPAVLSYTQPINSGTYSGNTYYYLLGYLYPSQVPEDWIVVQNNSVTSSNYYNYAYRYAYGDLAVDPEPPGPSYGQLKIGFTSSYAYSGGNSNAWRNNKDTIYFDRYDTLGNDLKGLNIELQAVPYTTEASSKQTLLGQRANEFIYDTVRVGSLGFYSPGQNPVDFTWEYITNRFSPTWFATYGDNWSLTGWYLSDHWYKVGWCYRARVVDDEMNTIIDWQTIYNGTSIDAQDTDNIINNNGYTPELVNSINEVNNFNNTTNNNYYNNQTINYNDGTLTSDGSWLEEFIRGIFETLGDIITAIIGFGSDIINGLFDLVSNLGVNLISFFRDLIDTITGADEQIDLTLPEWDPLIDEDGVLNEFKALGNGYVNIFVNSGLGYMLIIPLIIILLRLVF